MRSRSSLCPCGVFLLLLSHMATEFISKHCISHLFLSWLSSLQLIDSQHRALEHAFMAVADLVVVCRQLTQQWLLLVWRWTWEWLVLAPSCIYDWLEVIRWIDQFCTCVTVQLFAGWVSLVFRWAIAPQRNLSYTNWWSELVQPNEPTTTSTKFGSTQHAFLYCTVLLPYATIGLQPLLLKCVIWTSILHWMDWTNASPTSRRYVPYWRNVKEDI